MQETLYKTPAPQEFVSEYYEIVVLPRPDGETPSWIFIETHGWWDELERAAKNNVVTKCPEDGMTFEQAEEMFSLQRRHRAQEGFIYSFSAGPYQSGPNTIEI